MAGVLESVREEDFVQYYLFPNGFEDVINANEEREQRMQVALTHVESIVRKYAHNYIWHRDPFSINPINIPPLSLSSQEDDKGIRFICCVYNFKNGNRSGVHCRPCFLLPLSMKEMKLCSRPNLKHNLGSKA